jgi:hypothetical protein
MNRLEKPQTHVVRIERRRTLHWITCFLVAAFVCAMLAAPNHAAVQALLARAVSTDKPIFPRRRHRISCSGTIRTEKGVQIIAGILPA